jgi:two-component system, NtrC family, sensor kinase
VDGAVSTAAGESYRQRWLQTLVRLLLTYLAPLLLLTLYFHLQYRSLVVQSRNNHLMAIAENQASTLELFLRERIANLTTLIDDPTLEPRPSEAALEERLAQLQRGSGTFVDLGVFDEQGNMVGYAGPYPELRRRSYGNEEWFVGLDHSPQRFVITDMYLGFRQRPHFTIAVRRLGEGGPFTVRATLDPERLSEYIRTLKGAGEVHSVVVNSKGAYQTFDIPRALVAARTPLLPPHQPFLGAGNHRGDGATLRYAYCWLELTEWALIVVWTGSQSGTIGPGVNISFLAIAAALILAVFSTILIRASQVVRHQREEDRARKELSGQLHHATRLASVGELAAGVAHEINNPLAIIAEESGLLQDLMDPELGGKLEQQELLEHLGAIQAAAFRARDITRKLLSFVRKGDVTLGHHDLNELVEEVIGGLLEREATVSNIEVARHYGSGLVPVLCDRGQIEQVLVNLVTNAIDAMPQGGRLTLTTAREGEAVHVAVADTGIGIPPDQLERIFMPFHTTKEVGKGTGLGLSVSYGIVKACGGTIVVESAVGRGSTFTVVLPLDPTA